MTAVPLLHHDHACHLGESPLWDAINYAIVWVDITAGDIHQYFLAQQDHHVIHLDQMIGAVVLSSHGHFVGALKEGIAVIDRQSGHYKIIVTPEAHLSSNRFNDAKCDPVGRLWAGTLALDESHGAGSVYMIDEHFISKKMIGGVTISNGMAWSNDHTTFYYIDTPTQKVVAYDYDTWSGNIQNQRDVIDFTKEEGFPDGMTIDAEGMLWIAHWNGWKISRWDPGSGSKLLSVPLPVANVSSCAFAGDRLDDLIITSARKGLTESQLEAQPLAGNTFIIHGCGYQGQLANKFVSNIGV